jgi:hypothetical protein
MEVPELTIDIPCTEEEIPGLLTEKVPNLSEKAETTNNQLLDTIARYMKCVEHISTEILTEECSCCLYRQIVKGIEQDEGLETDY